jgi:hypothetical protein
MSVTSMNAGLPAPSGRLVTLNADTSSDNDAEVSNQKRDDGSCPCPWTSSECPQRHHSEEKLSGEHDRFRVKAFDSP